MANRITERKPKEINILNIIIVLAVVVLNIVLAFLCFRIRKFSASRVDGLLMIALILLTQFPLCLASDIYAGLNVPSRWYLPLVSPLTYYLLEPVHSAGSDPGELLTSFALNMGVMLVVAGIKALAAKCVRRKGEKKT